MPGNGKLTPLLVTVAFLMVVGSLRNKLVVGSAAIGNAVSPSMAAADGSHRLEMDAGHAAKKMPPQKWEIEAEAFEMMEERRAGELKKKRAKEFAGELGGAGDKKVGSSSGSRARSRLDKREKFEQLRRMRAEREAEEARIAEANQTPTPIPGAQPASPYEPVGTYENPYRRVVSSFNTEVAPGGGGGAADIASGGPSDGDGGGAGSGESESGGGGSSGEVSDGLEKAKGMKRTYEGHSSFMEWFKDAKEVQGATSKEICPENVKDCLNMVRWFRKHKARVVMDNDCIQSLPWLSRMADILTHELWGFRYVCAYDQSYVDQLREQAPEKYQMLHDIVFNHAALGPTLRVGAGGSVAGGSSGEETDSLSSANISSVNVAGGAVVNEAAEGLTRAVEIDLRPWTQHDFFGVDVVICREGFAFTKSYQRIWRFLSLVQAARVKLVAVDNYPSLSNVGENAVLWRPGGMRVVNVLRAPFNLPKPKNKVRGITASPRVMSALIEAKPDEYNETSPPIAKNLLLYTAEFIEYMLDKSPDRDLVWAARLEEMYAD